MADCIAERRSLSASVAVAEPRSSPADAVDAIFYCNQMQLFSVTYN